MKYLLLSIPLMLTAEPAMARGFGEAGAMGYLVLAVFGVWAVASVCATAHSMEIYSKLFRTDFLTFPILFGICLGIGHLAYAYTGFDAEWGMVIAWLVLIFVPAVPTVIGVFGELMSG